MPLDIEQLWRGWEGELNTPADYSAYFGTVEGRFLDIHKRTVRLETDVQAMARDLEQLVSNRVKEQGQPKEDPIAVLAAALATKGKTTTTTTTTPTQPAADPHASTTTPPTIFVRGAAEAFGGFQVTYDPAVPRTDRSGVAILTNSGGNFIFPGTQENLIEIQYGTPYAVRPFALAYIETDLTSPHAIGFIGTPANGGSTGNAFFQFIDTTPFVVGNGGQIRVRWRVEE